MSSIIRIFSLSSWACHFFHLWGRSRVDGILKNETKNMWYHLELHSSLRQSVTDWIFTDCDNSLLSHKVENFRIERYQHQVYYSTSKFHKNFTVCFMNDSSYIPMRESSITLCISKENKRRVGIFEMSQSQVSTISDERCTVFSKCPHSQPGGDVYFTFLERIHCTWHILRNVYTSPF